MKQEQVRRTKGEVSQSRVTDGTENDTDCPRHSIDYARKSAPDPGMKPIVKHARHLEECSGVKKRDHSL